MYQLRKRLLCLIIFICLSGACQSTAAPQYALTSYPLEGVKWASGLTYAWDSLWTVADRRQLVYRLSTDGKLQHSFKLNLTAVSALLAKQGLKLEYQELDMEGITADVERGHLYIISETNRLVLKITPQGKLIDIFPIKGSNPKYNQGLEGIAYSAAEDSLYIVEEGPLLGDKRLFCYPLTTSELKTYRLEIRYRLTGLCFYNGLLVAINVAHPIPSIHQILKLKLAATASPPQLLIDLKKEFGLSQNYEGITSDKAGNIYLINDSPDEAHSLLIKLSPRNSSLAEN